MAHGKFGPVGDVSKIPALEPGCRRIVQAVVDVEGAEGPPIGRASIAGDGQGLGGEVMLGCLALLVRRASMMATLLLLEVGENNTRPGEDIDVGGSLARSVDLLQDALLGGVQAGVDQFAGKPTGQTTVVQIRPSDVSGGASGEGGPGKAGPS